MGVCRVVFLPSIQTSDQGREPIVIEQSVPGSLGGLAASLAVSLPSVFSTSAAAMASAVSRGFFRFGPPAPRGRLGVTAAAAGESGAATGEGPGAAGSAAGGGGAATATGCGRASGFGSP